MRWLYAIGLTEPTSGKLSSDLVPTRGLEPRTLGLKARPELRRTRKSSATTSTSIPRMISESTSAGLGSLPLQTQVCSRRTPAALHAALSKGDPSADEPYSSVRVTETAAHQL